MSWKNEKLTEICTVTTGKWDANHASEKGEFRFYTCASKFLLCNTKRYDGKNIILPGNGANVGDVYFYDGAFDAYQRTYVLSDIKTIPEYLYYYLQSNWEETNRFKQYGSATNFLKIGNFKDFNVSYPPLVIQKKIVTKIDTIFAEIDKATVAAEANAENTYSLYSSAVDVIFDNLDNKYVNLSSCADIGYGYTSKSSIEFSGPQYLRITDIQEDKVDWLLVPRIQGKISEVKKFLLKDGDIVFARTGATTGKSYLIKNPPVSVFASYLIKVDANRNLVLPEYLRHLFRSEGYWNTINSGISGTAQGGFNASKLSELSFPLPDLDKQMKIVVELNRIEMLSITAKKSFDMKVNLLNSLKKSILKQAFNDELVKAA